MSGGVKEITAMKKKRGREREKSKKRQDVVVGKEKIGREKAWHFPHWSWS